MAENLGVFVVIKSIVSIIIPTYNRLWGLKDCIASIQAQDFVDWEVIVMDDAGIEPVEEHITSLQDPRIKYFRQEANVGVARNWVDGIMKAQSPYLCILMDDDWYHPNFLSNRVEVFTKNPDVGMVYGPYFRTDPVAGSRRLVSNRFTGYLTNRELQTAAVTRDCFIGACMYRLNPVQEIVGEAVGFGLIIDYAINLLPAIKTPIEGFVLTDPHFFYREHKATLSNTRTKEVWEMSYRFLSHIKRNAKVRPDSISHEIFHQALFASRRSNDRPRRVGWAVRAICAQPFHYSGYVRLIKASLNMESITNNS